MSKRRRTNESSCGLRQQATLLGIWKKTSSKDEKSASSFGGKSKTRERKDNNDFLQSTSRPANLLTKKQPRWENISQNNAPMLILRGGIGGMRKSSIRKSLAALPHWNENVTFNAYGRQCTMRRRICQYSLQGKFSYSYSGLKRVKAPAFPSNLYEIKCQVEDLLIEYILRNDYNLETMERDLSLSNEFIELIRKSAAAMNKNDFNRIDIFNYCLLNHYRNGEEYMSYHSDDESSLCPHCPIASVSLGVTRSFDVRQKVKKGNNNKKQSRIPLGDGDLLVMFPPMQHYYEHSIPVEKRVVGERINLTFRRIV
jgi:hypothetical protein